MSTELAAVGFESRLQKALDRVRLVLDANKAYSFAGNVHHQYQDKYLLTEAMTNAAAASQLNCLAGLGLTAEGLAQLRTWAQGRAVSLRLQAEERCSFLREETKEVEGATKRVSEFSMGAMAAALTSKTVTKVTEYFWGVEHSYELLAFRGVGETPDDRLTIASHAGRGEIKTSAKSAPRPESQVPAFTAETNISWLFRKLSAEEAVPAFVVDRTNKHCHTPRRNSDVDQAWSHFNKFNNWTDRVADYLETLFNLCPDPVHRPDLSSLRPSEGVLVPVLPLLRDGGVAPPAITDDAQVAGILARVTAAAGEEGGGSLGLEAADANKLLAEEVRVLAERRTSLAEMFPAGDKVATVSEAVLIFVLRHCSQVCGQWKMGVDYVEAMLRSQLIAAIGKEVTPADFAEYMRFHNRKLFAPAFAPVPFCFAVRRSESHAPEGTVSIEEEVVGSGGDSNIAAPIVTLAAHDSGPRMMQFPLSASTTLRFGGDRYLHAWLSHQFSGQSGAKLSLVSRARQFSSLLVLVGRIVSADSFEPKYASIVQNKDELKMPLDLSTIPTPKEFKDAIESLSPEQQGFAKAFRAMQLESTLFGVLIIQIKPQLEKVLNLPADSLTKEIKLTQDLMQLFIQYQIPSDLLSFDAQAFATASGAELVAPTATERLDSVKGHVKAMHEMIEKAKQEEIQEAQMKHSYEHPQPVIEPQLLIQEEVCLERAVPSSGMLRKTVARRKCAAPRGAAMGAPMGAPMGAAMPGAAAPPPPMAAMAAPPPPSSAPQPLPQQQPAQSSQPQPKPQQPQERKQEPAEGGGAAVGDGAVDYTQVPKEMDRQFERLDTDSALRPTIISVSDVWTKRAQKALLASPSTSTLHSDEQKKEKDAAFDLLDALTKSGGLPVDHASLHVVVAATHCFDKTVTETVVRDNINPIDKVERSTLIMASTVHRRPPAALMQEAQVPRVNTVSPMLFLEEGA